MPRYLLTKPARNGAKDACAEVEAGGVLEAARKVGWRLNDVKFKVLKNGRYQDCNIQDWLPDLGREILEDLRRERE
jgi:hypothetical protein